MLQGERSLVCPRRAVILQRAIQQWEEPMRAPIPAMTVLAMTMLASAYAPCALAQVVGETGPNVKLFANSKDVLALIDKVKADRKEGQPLISAPIIALAPYRAMLEYRAAKAPAALHETEAEMMYVIEGAGTIVTGGKLVEEKRNNPENLSGTDISGGSAQAITKGDFLVVPQNTPHQIAPTGGAPIILMTLHVPRKAAAQ
jgi:mannose-6-phosphate isomerase-like protein (cupin superfamily)